MQTEDLIWLIREPASVTDTVTGVALANGPLAEIRITAEGFHAVIEGCDRVWPLGGRFALRSSFRPPWPGTVAGEHVPSSPLTP